MTVVVLAATLVGITAIVLATNNPFLGLVLRQGDSGEVHLIADGTGPSTGLVSGSQLVAFATLDGAEITLSPTILVEEPDTLPVYDDLLTLFKESEDLYQVIAAGPVVVKTIDPHGRPQHITVRATDHRPLGSLPPAFWVQLVSGLMATFIGAWVWALNPASGATRSLLASGLALQISATTAAIYSTREIALPELIFLLLSKANALATLSFGAGLISLFLIYPKKLGVSPSLLWLVPLVTVSYALTAPLFTHSTSVGIYVPVLILFFCILVLIAIQAWYAHENLVHRQALNVLGLGVIFGAGSFVLTRALPELLDLPASITQGNSFVLILVLYAAVAWSVLRFRLFDLPSWSAKLLFYFVGACALVLLDATLVFVLAMDRTAALGLSLLVVGFLYLPLRDWARVSLNRRRLQRRETFLGLADFVVRSLNDEERRLRWYDVLTELYRPLEIRYLTDIDPDTKTEVRNTGESLYIRPPVPEIYPVELQWADNGQRLFNSTDRQELALITRMIRELLKGQEAHSIGVQQERARIARDLHDNLSISLLGALHSPESHEKNRLLREAMSDMRRIINDNNTGQENLATLLGEIRADSMGVLETAGMCLDWPLRDSQNIDICADVAHGLRSILRETINNARRHSSARNVAVDVHTDKQGIYLHVADDGHGAPDRQIASDGSGHGLANIRMRAERIGGTVTFDTKPGAGFAVHVTLPTVRSLPEAMPT